MYRVLLLGIGVIVAGLANIGGASSHPAYPGEGGYQAGYHYVPQYAVPSHPPAYAPPRPSVVFVPVPAAPVYMVPVPVPYAYPGAASLYARPANCGEYRYWDGTECVDARDVPPLNSRY